MTGWRAICCFAFAIVVGSEGRNSQRIPNTAQGVFQPDDCAMVGQLSGIRYRC